MSCCLRACWPCCAATIEPLDHAENFCFPPGARASTSPSAVFPRLAATPVSDLEFPKTSPPSAGRGMRLLTALRFGMPHQGVQGARRACDYMRRYLGVACGGINAAVSQQGLNDTGIRSALQQMRGEAVPESTWNWPTFFDNTASPIVRPMLSRASNCA